MKRLALIILAVLLTGCAAETPQRGLDVAGSGSGEQPARPEPAAPKPPAREPEPEESPPPLLKDRSAETDYALSSHAARFLLAETYAREGKRAAAAVVLSGVKSKLPDSALRERHYINLKIAECWGGPGPERDPERAQALIVSVEQACAQDARLLADAAMARCVCSLGAENPDQAEADLLSALGHYEMAQAHARYVEAARFALRAFIKAEMFQRALRFARLGYSRAREVDDPTGLALMALDSALLCFRADSGQTALEYLDEAYAASVKTGNAWLRNTIIAAAVAHHFRQERWPEAARWGDCLRDGTWGRLPTLESSALDNVSYARLLACYALAAHHARQGTTSRRRESLEAARQILEGVMDPESGDSSQAELASLLEKVQSALLQLGDG
ncbi:hypothetical protein EDM80_00495 [bacterium]|nr:MAG: hypothetical protein EDM80_00495 [bacterium]RIK64944.1 MAG: hypothetical protein DCC64_02390 [Planctomycetota bacterium]